MAGTATLITNTFRVEKVHDHILKEAEKVGCKVRRTL